MHTLCTTHTQQAPSVPISSAHLPLAGGRGYAAGATLLPSPPPFKGEAGWGFVQFRPCNIFHAYPVHHSHSTSPLCPDFIGTSPPCRGERVRCWYNLNCLPPKPPNRFILYMNDLSHTLRERCALRASAVKKTFYKLTLLIYSHFDTNYT